MARVGANDADNALAADDLALITDFFNAGSNLHDQTSNFLRLFYLTRSSIDPRVASKAWSLTLTLSPGPILTVILRASLEGVAITVTPFSNRTRKAPCGSTSVTIPI